MLKLERTDRAHYGNSAVREGINIMDRHSLMYLHGEIMNNDDLNSDILSERVLRSHVVKAIAETEVRQRLEIENLPVPDVIDVVNDPLADAVRSVIHDTVKQTAGDLAASLIGAAATVEQHENINSIVLPILHLTHIDSDAAGSMFVVTAMSDRLGQTFVNPVHVMNGNNYINTRCITAVLTYLYIVNTVPSEKKYIPKGIIITDIGPDEDTINAIIAIAGASNICSPMNLAVRADGRISAKEIWMRDGNISMFLYVDHHPTNPFAGGVYNKRFTRKLVDDKNIVVATNFHNLIESNAVIENEKTPFDETLAKAMRTGKCKCSATIISWLCVRNLLRTVMKSHVALEDIVFQAFDRMLLDISQWDTFEWRDHPELNSGTEKILVMATPYYDNALSLFGEVLYHWEKIFVKYIIEGSETKIDADANERCDWLYPSSMLSFAQASEKVLLKELSEARRTAIVLPITALTTDADLETIGATEDTNIVVVQYPALSNSSLFCQRLYEDLKTDEGRVADLVVMFSFTKPTLSLRTESTTIRCDKLAEMLGGGGHPQAAGFFNLSILSSLRETFIKENAMRESVCKLSYHTSKK